MASPFRLQHVSPIQSKYRDSDGNDIPIYRTSCPDCHNHVKEMIRIHELWQSQLQSGAKLHLSFGSHCGVAYLPSVPFLAVTKKDLRQSRLAHENLLKEYKEEVDKTARQHQRIVDGFHDEIEHLRADVKVKSEQVINLRNESSAIQQTCNDLNHQLSLTHERYAEQVSQNSMMAIRIRELEQALTQFRLEKESIFDQTVHQLREEVRTQTHETERRSLDLAARDREIHKLQEIIENQNIDLGRYKNVERKQNELFEAGSEERARLAGQVRQQNLLLDQQTAELRDVRKQLLDVGRDRDRAEEEANELRQQVRELRTLEEQMETNALGEFRRSRRQIEERLEKLQSECATVANMMSPSKSAPQINLGADRLPDWLPPAVSGLVRSFRQSLVSGGSNIGEEMSSFLIALNRIWRERMEEKLRLQRLHHAADIRELKRRLAQRIPYEQVVQKARILRLQKDLDTTRAVHLKAKGDQSKGLLDLSLGTVENLSQQILAYEGENNLLKTQISLLMNDKTAAGGLRSEADRHLASQAVEAVNALGDKVWSAANTYTDKSQRLAAGTEISSRLAVECQHFLDALEIDVRAAKAQVKRAVEEAQQADGGVAGGLYGGDEI